MSDETPISLFVFWRYHDGLLHTFLGGRADRLRSDGAYRVPSYGHAWCTEPVRVMSVEEGEALLDEIKAIGREMHGEIKRIKTAGKTRIEGLVLKEPCSE